MSCSVSEAVFYVLFLQAIGSWANNPTWGASQVRMEGKAAGIVKAE